MKTFFLIFIFLAALYFGTGGFIIIENDQKYESAKALGEKIVILNKISFYNKEIMEVKVQQEAILKIYPYGKQIPSVLSFLITAISFGIIGSLAKLVNDTIKKNKKLLETTNLLLIPVQGANIGLIILGISYTVPTVLTNENITLKPITVVILCLFGGVLYLDFYKWFFETINKTIISKKDN